MNPWAFELNLWSGIRILSPDNTKRKSDPERTPANMRTTLRVTYGCGLAGIKRRPRRTGKGTSRVIPNRRGSVMGDGSRVALILLLRIFALLRDYKLRLKLDGKRRARMPTNTTRTTLSAPDTKTTIRRCGKRKCAPEASTIPR
ncbi:hypothetical protein KQX54_021376 [Cotesia glomerata]|uniref:Uncharacterized protein n=1 Tax=Cotesia glomerata TaxID=32391 RepID=A0AAV7J9W1_COTGL|nr:hypothetical protein KQX54_021376 [Cotesia glomerata]